jgi:hypothetical protein
MDGGLYVYRVGNCDDNKARAAEDVQLMKQYQAEAAAEATRMKRAYETRDADALMREARIIASNNNAPLPSFPAPSPSGSTQPAAPSQPAPPAVTHNSPDPAPTLSAREQKITAANTAFGASREQVQSLQRTLHAMGHYLGHFGNQDEHGNWIGDDGIAQTFTLAKWEKGQEQMGVPKERISKTYDAGIARDMAAYVASHPDLATGRDELAALDPRHGGAGRTSQRERSTHK